MTVLGVAEQGSPNSKGWRVFDLGSLFLDGEGTMILPWHNLLTRERCERHSRCLERKF
jgi:hypothetical protein